MMTDEEFDAWQRRIRLRLQSDVAEAYEYARAKPSYRSQGMAYGISLYERLTRLHDQALEDD